MLIYKDKMWSVEASDNVARILLYALNEFKWVRFDKRPGS